MTPLFASYQYQSISVSVSSIGIDSKRGAIMSAPEYRLAHFRDHTFISLTTFRKNGEAVLTPVTFGEAQGSDKLYVVTGLNTGKMKRLQHNPAVELAPCNQKGAVLGTAVPGHVRILPAAEAKALRKQITFRAPAPILFVFNLLRDMRLGGNIFLEITLK
jgi:uncharacterized protein